MQLNSWMSFIHDEKNITELTIPGTHNSGAMYDVPALPDTAKTQKLTISEQLDIGVRFLDIRCKVSEDRFVIHNGFAHQKLFFENVLDICRDFLSSNPTESIILELRDESYPLNNPQLFEANFNKYIKKYSDTNLFFLEDKFPFIGEIRGKIVLLRNFEVSDITRKGISKRERVINSSVIKQNKHKDQTVEQKWYFIKQFFFSAKNDLKNILYLNYTSAYKKTFFLGLPSVKKISDNINPLVKGFLRLSANHRYGIIIMDYISKDSTQLIVNMNFPKEKVGGVIFFDDIFLRGNSTKPLQPGSYTLSELQNYNFNDKSVSSLVMPEGWIVEMYEEDNHKGKGWTLYKNDENSCNFTKFGFDTPNKKVSSITVTKPNHCNTNNYSELIEKVSSPESQDNNIEN